MLELLKDVLEVLLWLGAMLFLVPCTVLFLECLAASRRASPVLPDAAPLPRTTVLIPAHDEAPGVAATLESVLAAAFPQMDVLVVADNCTDATADLARAYGVRVVERVNPFLRGKDFAIVFGVEALRAQPPALVIVIDADCIVAENALHKLASCAQQYARPVQAAYVLRAIADATPKTALSNFAFRIKNVVRPLGLRRWGAPCLLTGSGMALPWHVLQYLSPSGHLSEDMWWSVELTCAGHAPRFCSDALVYGESPARDAFLATQRTRWERGHLKTMRSGMPKLIRAASAQRHSEPLWLALEMSVPPLTLLVCGVALWCVLAGIFFAAGNTPFPFALTMLETVMLVLAVFAAWWKFGRADLSARALLAVPKYIVWKIPLYIQMLRRRRTAWTRTARQPSAPGES